MKSAIRTILIVLVLIGGTASFGYWSVTEFDNIFDNLNNTVSVASTLPVSSFLKKSADLASTSPEMSGVFATSTDETISVTTSTTTTATTTPVIVASTGLKLSFTFPQKDDEVYIGCVYQISWQSSTVINSLETVLVDAGTGKSMGPVASGLAKENKIEKDLQNLKWKVGVVWPGSYYIKVSKINGVTAEFKSKAFDISEMPKNLNTKAKEALCKESNGSL